MRPALGAPQLMMGAVGYAWGTVLLTSPRKIYPPSRCSSLPFHTSCPQTPALRF